MAPKVKMVAKQTWIFVSLFFFLQIFNQPFFLPSLLYFSFPPPPPPFPSPSPPFLSSLFPFLLLPLSLSPPHPYAYHSLPFFAHSLFLLIHPLPLFPFPFLFSLPLPLFSFPFPSLFPSLSAASISFSNFSFCRPPSLRPSIPPFSFIPSLSLSLSLPLPFLVAPLFPFPLLLSHSLSLSLSLWMRISLFLYRSLSFPLHKEQKYLLWFVAVGGVGIGDGFLEWIILLNELGDQGLFYLCCLGRLISFRIG